VTFFTFLPFAAAIFSLLLAIASLVPKKRSPARLWFSAGMLVLTVDSLFTGLYLRANDLSKTLLDPPVGFIIKSFLPVTWLGFSLTYSRGDYRESLRRWRIPLAIIALLPILLGFGFSVRLLEIVAGGPAGDIPVFRFSTVAKIWNVLILVANVWILMNLEQTLRAAVGTMRWRIKFVVLGLAVIFGAHLYGRSQALLFSSYDMEWPSIESGALLIGCGSLAAAYVRAGFAEVDLYPSRAILGSSLTVLIVGGYLVIVGILANLAKHFGGAESFHFAAFIVLLGMAGLGLLLLSDRLRQRVHGFVHRHFSRAQHDSVQIWTEFSRRLANVQDEAGLCAVSAKLISETFEVLSVTIWLLDEQNEQFLAVASTALHQGEAAAGNAGSASRAVVAGVRAKRVPFDLDEVNEPWVEELRQLNPSTFPTGGHRWCVPFWAGEQCLGTMVLADRVSGARYSGEELQLLQCIEDQVTSVLLNLRLANEVARARELEAFRTMSAFFVHDLKNAAASLNLMLNNLPVHFDDAAFRQDTLRGIGNTARRIDEMIGKLGALRQRPVAKPMQADLNQLVNEVLNGLNGMTHVELTKEFQPLPSIFIDCEQMRSVVTNLVLNARDALGEGGRIHLRTEPVGDRVVLTVADNGCGMCAEFLRVSLFRPFQSTKRNGLGIGTFQSRMIVEAHGGSIRVESEPGKGSTFQVSLPAKDAKCRS